MCNHLITIKNPKTGELIQVPCGHCINCLSEMQAEWATRLTLELRSNLERPAVFVTLTYNDENLPTDEFNPQTGEVYQKPSVVKAHVQQFMKSLRGNIDRQIKRGTWKGYKGPLKYFFTSEYGPTGGRPHYHGIIFGITKQDLPLIEQIWHKGFVHVGDVNEKTITYCSKYCLKPMELSLYPERAGYFDNEKWMDDNGIRRKPFRLMSTKLGIGYLNDSQLRFHFRDIFMNNYIRVGKIKKKLPRYYKQKIYTEENMKKFGDRKQLIKLINKTRKNDFKYDLPYYHYDITNIIGRAQYYRHLDNTIENSKISKTDDLRDFQDTRKREDLLVQNRLKWYRRRERYHQQ